MTKFRFLKIYFIIPNKAAYIDDETWSNVEKAVTPTIREMKVRNVAYVCLFYSLYIQLPFSSNQNYLQTISDLTEQWSFLTYDGFKSNVNVTEGLYFFAEERIKVRKDDTGTSTFNQKYDKFWVNYDHHVTRQILYMVCHKVNGWTNQWQLVMIISTSIQNISAKLCTDSFVATNIHPNHYYYFSYLIKNIAPYLDMGDTYYFSNYKGSYYNSITSI